MHRSLAPSSYLPADASLRESTNYRKPARKRKIQEALTEENRANERERDRACERDPKKRKQEWGFLHDKTTSIIHIHPDEGGRKSKETDRPVVSSLLFDSSFTLGLSGLNYGRLPLLRRDNLFRRIVPSIYSTDTRVVSAAPCCDLRVGVPSIYVASVCKMIFRFVVPHAAQKKDSNNGIQDKINWNKNI